VHGVTDARHHFNGVAEKLVVQLGMVAVRSGPQADIGEQVRGGVGQVSGGLVDKGELPLHAQGRFR